MLGYAGNPFCGLPSESPQPLTSHLTQREEPVPVMDHPGVIRCLQVPFTKHVTFTIQRRARRPFGLYLGMPISLEPEIPMPDPAVDFHALGGVNLDRLERCLHLHAVRLTPGRYRVVGGAHTHWVDLYTASLPRCDCGDHLWRDQICKHILAALLREGDERVLSALRELVVTLRCRPMAA